MLDGQQRKEQKRHHGYMDLWRQPCKYDESDRWAVKYRLSTTQGGVALPEANPADFCSLALNFPLYQLKKKCRAFLKRHLRQHLSWKSLQTLHICPHCSRTPQNGWTYNSFEVSLPRFHHMENIKPEHGEKKKTAVRNTDALMGLCPLSSST